MSNLIITAVSHLTAFPKGHRSEGKDSPEKRHIQYDSLIAIVVLAD